MSLKGVSLGSALDLLLDRLGLTWTIRSEVLLITTPQVANDLFLIRVYDVADLVRCRDKTNVVWDDYDSLIDAIEQSIEPDSWQDTGAGQGVVVGQTFANAHVLVVSNTPQVHGKIAKLLDDVRAVGAKAGPNLTPPMRSWPRYGWYEYVSFRAPAMGTFERSIPFSRRCTGRTSSCRRRRATSPDSRLAGIPSRRVSDGSACPHRPTPTKPHAAKIAEPAWRPDACRVVTPCHPTSLGHAWLCPSHPSEPGRVGRAVCDVIAHRASTGGGQEYESAGSGGRLVGIGAEGVRQRRGGRIGAQAGCGSRRSAVAERGQPVAGVSRNAFWMELKRNLPNVPSRRGAPAKSVAKAAWTTSTAPTIA